MHIMCTSNIEKFNHSKYQDLSDHYKVLDSRKVMDNLVGLGLDFEGLSSVKARKGKRDGFQKHVMIFDTKRQIDNENRIRLLVTNSYDGTNSLSFKLGIYRSVCANGLVAGESLFSERIIHKGESAEEQLYKIVAKIPEKAEELTEIVKKMQETKFDEKTGLHLIDAAIKFKHEETTQFEPNDFKAVRSGDKDNNVYNLFNVVQETIMKGNYKFKDEGKDWRKARPVKSVGSSVKINQFLFDSAQLVRHIASVA